VLDTLFHALVRWLSPVLVFTSEEVWSTRYPDAGSVHLLEWPVVPQVPALGEGWFTLRKFRQSVNGLIEPMRRAKEVGSSNEVEIIAEIYDLGILDYLTERKVDLAELCIVSSVKLTAASAPSDLDKWLAAETYRGFTGVGKSLEYGLTAALTGNHKCGRCWRYLPEVRDDGELCARCEDVVNG
jgi:isoleucyl-tRNA synthetase